MLAGLRPRRAERAAPTWGRGSPWHPGCLPRGGSRRPASDCRAWSWTAPGVPEGGRDGAARFVFIEPGAGSGTAERVVHLVFGELSGSRHLGGTAGRPVQCVVPLPLHRVEHGGDEPVKAEPDAVARR